MNQQYFLGLKDNDTLSTPYIYNQSTGSGLVELEARYVTDTATGKQFRYIDGLNNSKEPWVIKLDRGDFPNSPSLVGSERVTEEAVVAGGIVFFVSFIPDQNVCAGNGDTWLFALDYETGLAPAPPVFDANGDGVIDEEDVATDASGNTFAIAGIPVGSGQGSKPVLFGDTLFVITTGGGLTTLPVNLPETKVDLRFWRHN